PVAHRAAGVAADRLPEGALRLGVAEAVGEPHPLVEVALRLGRRGDRAGVAAQVVVERHRIVRGLRGERRREEEEGGGQGRADHGAAWVWTLRRVRGAFPRGEGGKESCYPSASSATPAAGSAQRRRVARAQQPTARAPTICPAGRTGR